MYILDAKRIKSPSDVIPALESTLVRVLVEANKDVTKTMKDFVTLLVMVDFAIEQFGPVLDEITRMGPKEDEGIKIIKAMLKKYGGKDETAN